MALFFCCFPWVLSTVPKWALFAAMCDWGTYWLTLMTLIGKVGSVSGSLTDWLAWQECDWVAPAYCLGHPINYLLTAMDTFPNACLRRWKTDPSFPSNRFPNRWAVMWLFLLFFYLSGLQSFKDIRGSIISQNNLTLLFEASKLVFKDFFVMGNSLSPDLGGFSSFRDSLWNPSVQCRQALYFCQTPLV